MLVGLSRDPAPHCPSALADHVRVGCPSPPRQLTEAGPSVPNSNPTLAHQQTQEADTGRRCRHAAECPQVQQLCAQRVR